MKKLVDWLYRERNLRLVYQTLKRVWFAPEGFGARVGLGRKVYLQGFGFETWKNDGMIINSGFYIGDSVGIVNGYTEIVIEKREPGKQLVATGWKPSFADQGVKEPPQLTPRDIAALFRLCEEIEMGRCTEEYLLDRAGEELTQSLRRVSKNRRNTEKEIAVYTLLVHLYQQGIDESKRRLHGQVPYPLSWGDTEVFHNGVINYTHYHFVHLRGQDFGTTKIRLAPVYDGGIDEITVHIKSATVLIAKGGRLQIEGFVWLPGPELQRMRLQEVSLTEIIEYLEHAVARDNFFRDRRSW